MESCVTGLWTWQSCNLTCDSFCRYWNIGLGEGCFRYCKWSSTVISISHKFVKFAPCIISLSTGISGFVNKLPSLNFISVERSLQLLFELRQADRLYSKLCGVGFWKAFQKGYNLVIVMCIMKYYSCFFGQCCSVNKGAGTSKWRDSGRECYAWYSQLVASDMWHNLYCCCKPLLMGSGLQFRWGWFAGSLCLYYFLVCKIVV